MFAIAFDLVVADTEQHHPRGVSAAYSDIRGHGAHGLLVSVLSVETRGMGATA